MSRPAADAELDVRGLNCPLPLLKAKLALRRLPLGALLHVRATDPLSRMDFAAWCERSGNRLELAEESGGVWELYVRKLVGEQGVSS